MGKISDLRLFDCKYNRKLPRGVAPWRLHGSAIFVAVAICIVIGLLMSSLTLASYFQRLELKKALGKSQLDFNIQSAFVALHSRFFDSYLDNVWVKNVFNDDSTLIVNMPRGAYQMVSIETKNRIETLFVFGLVGTHMSLDSGLVVADGRPVSFAGKVELRNSCYLPQATFNPGSVAGLGYVPDANSRNHIRRAPTMLPAVSKNFVNGIKAQKHLDVSRDSTVSELPPQFQRSFKKRQVVWEPDGNRISNMTLKGNIKIVSSFLVVDSSTHLSDVVIVCDRVLFRNGFKGTCHVIATDSVVLEKKCDLLYPSSIVLFDNLQSPITKAVVIGPQCSVSGAIVAVSEDRADNPNILIKTGFSSEVKGLVYSKGMLHLEGSIKATAYGRRLVYLTKAATYENYLVNCSVSALSESKSLLIPDIFDAGPSICLAKYD